MAGETVFAAGRGPWDLPLFAQGFRPFFLIAAVYAPLSLLPWIGPMLFWFSFDPGMPAPAWHGHEMIFGVAGAALAGFMLTAIPSWTGRELFAGRRLIVVVLTWYLGRVGFWLAGWLPAWLVTGLDLVFPLLLTGWVLHGLLTPAGQPHRSLLWLTLAWLAAVLLFHGARHGLIDRHWLVTALDAGVYVFLLMIAVAVSRIIRVVGRIALERAGHVPRLRILPARENLAVLTLVLFAVVAVVAPQGAVTGWIALAAAAAQLDRLADWPWNRALRQPFLLFLTTAMLWLILGLILTGLGLLTPLWSAEAGRHAFGMGAMGTAILAVFCIAALRHTGRPLRFPRLVWGAFACLTMAGAVRTFVPLLLPQHYLTLSIGLASLLWLAAFLFYVFAYVTILWRARPDGEVG